MSTRQFVAAEPKRKRPNDWTPPYWHIGGACEDGDLEAVQWYIDERERQEQSYLTDYDSQVDDVDINEVDDEGRTPLYRACERGHLKVVKLLLKQDGIDINEEKFHDERTPLYIACYRRHLEVVKLLLKQPRIRVNKKADEDNKTPLYMASENGYTEVVRLLLACGKIRINQSNDDDKTPLYIACERGRVEVVRLLLAAGADANKAGKDGDTPLYIACSGRFYGQTISLSIVKALLARRSTRRRSSTPGIDINKANRYGRTPLHVACIQGDLELVKELLKQPGIDINKKGSENNKKQITTPLCLTSGWQVEIVDLLLARPEIDIYPSLFRACSVYGNGENEHKLRRLLRVPGINPNKRNEMGLTPLMIAAKQSRYGILRILMDDPRVEFEDTITLTASQLARIMGSTMSGSVIDQHRRVQQRMANRVFVRRPIDQGKSGEREAPIHIGHKVGSYLHHDVKTKLKF